MPVEKGSNADIKQANLITCLMLAFDPFRLLNHAGRISHDLAEALAKKEYEIYKKQQDRLFESDFDKEIKKLLEDIEKV